MIKSDFNAGVKQLDGGGGGGGPGMTDSSSSEDEDDDEDQMNRFMRMNDDHANDNDAEVLIYSCVMTN